ncbi:MAG: DUF371 domain-containing protein [Promethearchaeota archaeon]
MEKKYSFYAYGHPNIRSTHKTTLEITKENFLTTRGDCILGINAESSCRDLPQWLKAEIRRGNKFLVELLIKTENNALNEKKYIIKDHFYGYGDKDLPLKSEISMVFRRSNFICNRTILIKCSKSAKDINRDLVEYLKKPKSKLKITIKKVEPSQN